MAQTVGTRDILRNPSLLRISPNDSIIIEDKRAHKILGVYLGTTLAKEFILYQKRAKLLQSAKKISTHSKSENILLEGVLDDGL
jgi:hypothetical protein